MSEVFRKPGVRALALAVAIVAVYAASLAGGFLNYDDDWLIERNPFLDAPSGKALRAFFFDLSFDTRYALGAEYLPLRDVSVWLEVQLFGRNPQALRSVQLGLYVLAMLGFRAAFVTSLGAVRGELLAWLFALHPVHVESAAWLAGRKDVLALVFMGWALARHAKSDRDARFSVPLLWLCACLSKSMAVGFVGPMLATDVYLRRRPDATRYGLGFALVGLAMALHVHVGSLMHMVSGPLASSRLDAFWTMGPIWLRYLWSVFDPRLLSVRHDLDVLHGPTALSLLGWALLLASAGLSVWLWARRDRKLPLTAWLWFAVPLAPVSQVLVPLQNVMADRYLWLSVAGPLLVLAHLDLVLRSTVAARTLAIGLCGFFATLTSLRAPLFADSVWLFIDATQKTERDPTAPYQLGKALEEKQPNRAMDAFAETLARAEPRDRARIKASNNLARLLVHAGNPAGAKVVLERALMDFPEDEKLQRNYVKVLARLQVRQGAAFGTERPTAPRK